MMENKILHLEYDFNEQSYQRVWFDEFKKTLPNIFAFWGTGFLLSLLLLILFKGENFFIFLTFTFIAIPTFIILNNYRTYNSYGKNIVASYPKNQRQIIVTFATENEYVQRKGYRSMMENKILHLEYDFNEQSYQRVWFDEFKKTLPNIFAFWGTGFLLSLLLLILFKGENFFIFLTFTFIAIPTFIILNNYRTYNSYGKNIVASYPKNQRQIIVTFATDGFDFILGKNFSHISWETVKNVIEKEDFFIFTLNSGPFHLPKTAFRNDSERIFLRQIISLNIGSNAKLLD